MSRVYDMFGQAVWRLHRPGSRNVLYEERLIMSQLRRSVKLLLLPLLWLWGRQNQKRRWLKVDTGRQRVLQKDGRIWVRILNGREACSCLTGLDRCGKLYVAHAGSDRERLAHCLY